MKKNLFKRGMAGLLSLVMCLTALMGIGTTTAYAAGERAEVYLVSFPRSGDANIDYSGTWGHPNLRYMNGWHSGESKYTTIRAMHSYDGKQAELYGELADLVNATAQTDAATEPAEQIPYSEEKMLLPELAELYQQNGDLVGWISIADTNINYPVMQSVNEPNFYLKHGFDKEYSDYGCPYVQEDCDVQEPSDNLVIYGHHMSNGSMFAHLEKFKSKDFWSEHRMITFNTLTDKQEYEIVAVFRTVVYTDSPEAFKFYRFIDAESANEFDDFIAKSKELSFYDTGVTAEYGDKLITLSTCEYSRNNSRLVVVAKRITEDGGVDAAKTHAEAAAESERPN